MLHMFDKALESVGYMAGPPYFDWSAQSSTWSRSDVWQYLGPNPGPAPDNCIAGFTVSPDPPTGPTQLRAFTGNPTCLRRCGNTAGAMVDAVAIAAIYSSATNFVNFQGDDTTNYHAVGHFNFGGGCDMGNPYYSPNDPIFY
ncbi:hypothetical protein HDU76_010582, partial [Blyttiomyces sp. JEL0837]